MKEEINDKEGVMARMLGEGAGAAVQCDGNPSIIVDGSECGGKMARL